jgi:hypothetical protein
MGLIASFMDRRLGAELNERKVLVWYDPGPTWGPWIARLDGPELAGSNGVVRTVQIGGREAHLVVSTGSHYEVVQACEKVIRDAEARLLVYVPGEPYLEMLSPLRELECLGGQKDPFQRELGHVARQALQSAGIADSKIDEFVAREGLDFTYLDSISVGDGGASPLSPVFGSSRELDVIPSFLAEPERRAAAADKALLPEIVSLAASGLGLWVQATGDAEALARALARALLVAEMRSDLDGPEPVAISQIAGPRDPDQVKRVRDVCRKLRSEYPTVYEDLADSVERGLGLSQAGIDPEALGNIDTFRFEERSLLALCDQRLAEGQADRVVEIVDGRLSREGGAQPSFWASVLRFPARHAAWAACGELARLAKALDVVERALKTPPRDPAKWVAAYTAADGWHRVDQAFREARYRLSRLEDAAVFERGAECVFARYEALIDKMGVGFVAALQAADWDVPGALRQEEIFDRRVARKTERTAYLLADAMRFEMGAELVRLVEACGAMAVQLEPAIAVAPTITDLGMAALLPGAERSFSMQQTPKGVTGSIDGKALVGSTMRMDYAKGVVPGLVEMTLERFVHELTPKKREQEFKDAKIVILRSQEIDGIGENLPAGVAQKVMGTILEDLRSAVQRLADCGVRHFVLAADHGHLFASARGDDMKIDLPEGGTMVDVHRRCWVGRGGTTPSSCVRLSAADLGYEGTDLELVVPKGTGVFKSQGSLAFHHGGLSLQELVIPVLSFELEGRKAAKKSGGDVLTLENVGQAITNRIFAVRLKPLMMLMAERMRVRVLAQSTADGKTVAQVGWASEGWDSEARTVTFVSGQPVDVRLVLDDDQVAELRIVVMQVDTDRTLKDTQPIPVQLGVN